MTTSFRVRLLRRQFHGLRDDGSPDWPPSPTRLLGALIAGSHSLPEESARKARSAVAKISSSPHPIIDLPQSAHLNVPETYTESTSTPDKVTGTKLDKYLDTSHLAIPTRSRTPKPQDAMALVHDEILFHVDLELSAPEREALGLAVKQIPYFGRSQDVCEVEVLQEPRLPELTQAFSRRLYPFIRSYGETRGWLPATPKWYDRNHERILGADETTNRLPPHPATGYVQPLLYQDHQTNPTYGTIVQLPQTVPHHHIPREMKTLEQIVLDADADFTIIPITQSIPPWGKGACIGIGVYPNIDSDSKDGGTPDPEPVALAIDAAFSDRGLQPRTPVRNSRAVSLDPQFWAAQSTKWRSSTPLRAFPDPRVIGAQLEKELADLYDARIVKTIIRREPAHGHEHRWADSDSRDGLGQWWVELETDVTLTGPIQLGSGRHLGYGVFQPMRVTDDS